MQIVKKFPTGAEIPVGAIFLSTEVEKVYNYSYAGGFDPSDAKVLQAVIESGHKVWHYFLIEDGINEQHEELDE